MRLLDIANRYYLITLLVVFLVGSLAAYFVLKSIINKEFNDKLYAEKEQLLYELKHYDNLRQTYYLNIGDVIAINEVPNDPKIAPSLRDTVMYDPYEKKELPFRLLTFSEEIKEKFYVVTISKSLLPYQDLIEGVSEIMIGLALVLMLALGLLNRIIFKKLWFPFHQIVEQITHFNITNPQPIKVEESSVEEFKQLKSVLDRMISKSINDYKTLKEYTENTSHEIQTPLAIIKNKAEMLLQEPLQEQHLSEISKIYDAAGRLSRLKEGLSLLTKIDNNQFQSAEPVALREYLTSRLSGFEELIQMKNIAVSQETHSDPVIRMNSDLVYMLITNLLSNAIKHNFPNGQIMIMLNDQQLTIKNTGKKPEVPTELLFARFKSSGTHSESTGLGLSIVERIAHIYGMKISYTFEQGLHDLTLSFNPTQQLVPNGTNNQ